MLTLTILAVLVILLVVVLRKLFKKGKQAAGSKPVEDLSSTPITEARKGDSVSVNGAGDQFSDLDFVVESRNQYEVGQRRWIELRGAYRERRVMIEIWAGDELEVSVVPDSKRLTLEDLGLSEEDLSQIDERQNTADNFEYEAKPWYYLFSREFVLFRDSQTQGTSFYGWVFREDGGARTMLIRKAESEGFAASIGARVNPGDITVYRAG
jgi:hypothetical protein